MATKKSNVKKEEIVEEVKETKNQESEEMIALRKQIEEMKKAMELLMKNKANTPSERVYVKQAEDEVVIGCRVLQGIGWGRPEDPAGEIRLDFNEEQSVTVSDMRRFFRQNSIRRLFEDGLCYYAEPENYTLYNIRKHIDLSNENLINILTQDDINDIIRDLDKLTSNKKNSSIINCIVFRICDMIRTNVLTWDYYSRKAIEGYFDMEFDRGISTLTALDKIKR
ncbi:MAG: hypothetical protein ACLTPN_02665 [Clostridia bacterium]